MYGCGREDAALLLVMDQRLPARHRLKHLAVLSSPQYNLDGVPEHNLYHPVVRLMRLMDDLMKHGLGASVPHVPGRVVGTRTCSASLQWHLTPPPPLKSHAAEPSAAPGAEPGVQLSQSCTILHLCVGCRTPSLLFTMLQAPEQKQDAAAHREAVQQVCQLTAL